MHIAVDEARAAGSSWARHLRRAADAHRSLKGVPFALSPAWLDTRETETLARVGKALQTIADELVPILASQPSLRRRLTPKWRDIRWMLPPVDARAAVSLRAWSASLPWWMPRTSPFVRIRPDAFWIDGALRIIEINVGSMSTHVVDALASVFRSDRTMNDLLEEKADARSLRGLAAALIDEARALTNRGDVHAGCFLNPDVPNPSALDMLDALKAEGAEAVAVPPGALRWQGDGLSASGRRLTLVLNEGAPRALHAFKTPARLKAKVLLALAQRRRVACTYPLPYEWIFSKALFALLSDGSLRGALDAQALATLEPFLAWTRLTEEKDTPWLDGSPVALREAAARYRADLVLKPAFGTQGAGVRLGDETDPAEWRALLDRAFAAKDHVLQERLRPKAVQVVRSDTAETVEVIHDVCPVITRGQVTAVWGRYSTSPMTGFLYNVERKTRAYGWLPTWTAPT